MAVWKLPERLEVRAAFPMTPSGKIQKYLLREEIAGTARPESAYPVGAIGEARLERGEGSSCEAAPGGSRRGVLSVR